MPNEPDEEYRMTEFARQWRAAGACLSADPDLFYPITSGRGVTSETRMALRICAGCPVRQQCLDFAMRSPEVHGIWGGTTPADRLRARRRRAERRRRASGPSWPGAPETRAS
jgi:WhiB family transcriptional regulator, redox-sensing transcriptional regulator